MGLFADNCVALIDKDTGKALTGEALKQAKLDSKWPRCGFRVTKKARFCGKCGHGALGGWWKCPNLKCGKWVGNESSFCWNCNQALHPESRDDISGGVWIKAPEVFAQRFEAGNVAGHKQDYINVQTGQAAILLDGGRVQTVLGPGRHTAESAGHHVNWWGNPPPRSFILVDNGDIVLPVRIEALRSADEFEVELYCEATLHFNEKNADDFVANLFKNSERMSYEQLSGDLEREVRYAAENMCNTSTIEDLVKDPERRLHLEETLRQTMRKKLERCGMEIVRVASADFVGQEYEELRRRAGDTEVKRRNLEFDQQMRELLSSNRMNQLKTETELEEYVATIAQERQVSEAHRDQELKRLKQVYNHELEKSETEYQMAKEMDQVAHSIGVKLKWDDYTRNKLREDAELQDRLRRIEIDTALKEAAEWLDVKAKKQRLKRENLAETAKIMEGKSTETLIALIDDPARREQLLELHKRTVMQGMSEKQMLAANAVESPELARLIYEMEKAANTDRDKEWEERKRMQDEMAARLERVLKSALETTAEAAKNPGSSTNIIK